MQRRTLIAGAIAAFAMPAYAMPRAYRLGPDGATIIYTFTMNGEPFKGTVPIDHADLNIDATDLGASTADFTADVRRARTGLIFATEALKSSSVLAAKDFPLARFQSTRVILGEDGRISDGAAIEGLLTLRGITLPMRFDARLFRNSGAGRNDARILNLRMSGRVNRHDYGADGYANLVDDTVKIEIQAQIETPL